MNSKVWGNIFGYYLFDTSNSHVNKTEERSPENELSTKSYQ